MTVPTASTINKPTLLFCGSFVHYSVQVLAGLVADQRVKVLGVVTTPPQPKGRKKLLTPTPVQLWAETHDLPVLTPQVLDSTSLKRCQAQLGVPDFLITAGYGKLLPPSWLHFPSRAALNLHFSLLPAFRGANPAEWALAMGETETGITLIEMSPEFDTGALLTQATLPITSHDTRITVYEKLYRLGGQKLSSWILDYAAGRLKPEPQPASSPTPYAKRLTRSDGFLPWKLLEAVITGQTFNPDLLSPSLQKMLQASGQTPGAVFVEKLNRALAGFPSLWTEVNTNKGMLRMKILECTVIGTRLQLSTVHLAGEARPVAWEKVKPTIEEKVS